MKQGATLPVGPLMFWSAVGLALLHTGARPAITNDLHIYLAQGRWMVENGALLEQEIFTWTAGGVPYINATWGYCVAGWLLHQLGGLDLLRVFNGVMVAAAVGFIGAAARARGVDGRAAALAALYAWGLMFQNTVIRGQTWVFPVFAALVLLAARPRRWWVAAGGGFAAGVVWNALHGSFPAGIVWAGAMAVGAAAEKRDWRAGATPALIGLGLALGACIGPYGPAIWVYVFEDSALSRSRNVGEWLPPDITHFEGARFYGALGLWALLLLRDALARTRRVPWADLLVVIGFGYLATTGTRFVAWFALASAAPLAARLGATMSAERGFPVRLMKPLYGLFAVMWALFIVKGLSPRDSGPDDRGTPVALVDALAADAKTGRLLGAPEYGGYVSYRLWPGWLHSGDIRVWVFDDPAWNLYLEASRAGPGWEALLEEHGVTHLLTWAPFHGETLQAAAAASPRWETLAETENGAAFRRVPPGLR